MEIVKTNDQNPCNNYRIEQLFGYNESNLRIPGVVEVLNKFSKVPDNTGYKFTYWLEKNLELIKRLKKDIEEKIAVIRIKETDPEFNQLKEYEIKKEELFIKYCRKNEKGEAIKNKNGYDIPEEVEEQLKEEILKLDGKYPKVVARIEKFNEDYKDIMMATCTISWFSMVVDKFPSGLLPSDVMIVNRLLTYEEK